MSRHHLAEFEEVVMLTVAILQDEAYGVAIINEIEQRLKRKVSMGSMQTVLKRLEQKGYLSSAFGEATQRRGGKRKRYFMLTTRGKSMLEGVRDQRTNLWDAIPEIIVSD